VITYIIVLSPETVACCLSGRWVIFSAVMMLGRCRRIKDALLVIQLAVSSRGASFP
jgi:hypothetical protein